MNKESVYKSNRSKSDDKTYEVYQYFSIMGQKAAINKYPKFEEIIKSWNNGI